jgi:hypothetical protein
MLTVKVGEDEINRVLNLCAIAENDGTKAPSMIYELGVKYGINWILGNINYNPPLS